MLGADVGVLMLRVDWYRHRGRILVSRHLVSVCFDGSCHFVHWSTAAGELERKDDIELNVLIHLCMYYSRRIGG